LLAATLGQVAESAGAYHLSSGRRSFLSLALAGNESGARNDRWADEGGGLAESGPRERAKKACGVHDGLCWGQRAVAEVQWMREGSAGKN